jgi:N-acetylglutamate synthase-like GNAT family acetyltransferase
VFPISAGAIARVLAVRWKIGKTENQSSDELLTKPQSNKEKTGDEMKIKIVKPSWKKSRAASREIRVHNQKQANMLERTPRDIRNSPFWIALGCGKKLLGCIGLFDWGADGVEIVSHLVLGKFRGLYVGKNLLEMTLRETEKLNPASVFIFTTEIEYYKKFGFELTDVHKFPEKLRLRCQNCPNGPNGPGFAPCQETAMELKRSKTD